MANIMDYLDWRGDVPFSVDPFNEVDNLVLSVLAYTDFENVVPVPRSGGPVGIREVYERYYSLHTHEEIRSRETFFKNAPFLLDKLAVSERFSGLKLCNYLNMIDPENDLQMSAVTYIVGDGSVYTAYRGTDDTLTGWKEDFDLAYMEKTTGQAVAVDYLNYTQAGQTGPLRVGGHSKGGNFAIYASVYCDPAIRERITCVYSNDGPGFIDEIAHSEEFRILLPRIRKFTPAASMIGTLLSGDIDTKIIQSTQTGIMQHDAFSWEILRSRIVEADERTRESIFFDKTMRRWIDSQDTEHKKRFIDTLFGLLEKAGASTTEDLQGLSLVKTAALMKAVDGLPKEEKEVFVSVLKDLFASGRDTLIAGFRSRIRQGRETAELPE